MLTNSQWIGAVVIATALVGGTAEAQPFYGGGYWGGGYGGYGGGAGSTVQGSILQGAGMAAMGMGRYNVETAQARSINSNTAMRWNQYMYEASKENNRIYNERLRGQAAREKNSFNAIKERLRDNPNSVDIANGNALNIAMEDLNDPKVFPKTLYYAGKMKIGGASIRDIPFQYAQAGISTSVHALTTGGAPAVLKNRPEFDEDRAKLRALADQIRKEGEEDGAPKPETIKLAKAQIMATRAKVDQVFPRNTQDRRDAEGYLKAIYGLASMFETPAIGVLLAGVENRPEATVGDLIGFMSAYNLRFGASTTPAQQEVYRSLFPMISQLRTQVAADTGPAPAMPAEGVANVPLEVFGGLDYNHAEAKAKAPTPPAPK